MSRDRRFLPAVILVLAAFLLAGHLFYLPPLLGGRPWNLPGRLYDFLAHAYHSTRAQWLANEGREAESRRAIARAAWHRPAGLSDLWSGQTGDLFGLGRKYLELGLEKLAQDLFRSTLESLNPGEDLFLETVSCLALLGDWSAALPGSREYLHAHPESAEGRYWLGRAQLETGRPEAARPLLLEAYRRDGSLIDALYQAARSEEKSGQNNRCRERYEEVVSILPNHLDAWQALERLYAEIGDREKHREARSKVWELTPSVIRQGKFNNRAVLTGYGLNPDKMETGAVMTLEVRLRGWRPAESELAILVQLVSEKFSGRVEARSEPFPVPSAGEVVKQSLTWQNPFHLYPTDYRIEIAFEELSARPGGGSARPDPGAYHSLASLELTPRWLPARTREPLVRQYFGARAFSLGKRTFLGPHSELDLKINGRKATAVGLVTTARCYSSFPQEKEFARLIVVAGEGEEFEFPLRMGIESSNCWWAACPPELRRHGLAPIFRSWQVRRGGGEFPAYEYGAVFLLPQPRLVSGLRIKNVSENAGFEIVDIIIIPDRIGDRTEI